MGTYIFAGGEAAQRLQAKIHEAVRDDISRWQKTLVAPVAIIESAIMMTSGLDRLVDRIWLVQAPQLLRIERVQLRSALDKNDIMRRMAAQQSEFDELPAHKVSIIHNDGSCPLIPQVNALLADITETK